MMLDAATYGGVMLHLPVTATRAVSEIEVLIHAKLGVAERLQSCTLS
jgi:hypothetical protein